MAGTEVDSKITKWLITGGVLMLAAINASWMLSARTLDSHECLVSITAREMLESGDWILPTCNGKPRINKTPLSYWLVAGLANLTGKIDELTARLPSAISAFLSAMVILYFVNQWLSFRIAALSTAVWVTSLSYIRCSHIARPEMALAFFIIVCLMSFYSAIIASSRKSQVIYMLVFWISLGLGNLAKGPAPLAYVFVPVLSYILINRKWKTLVKLLPILGPIIVMVIMLPWPLAIAHRMNWNIIIWKHEFFDRFFGEYARGNYVVYYYLGIMFKYITPWVAFLPMALVAPFYKAWEEKRPVTKFLWLWFVAGLIFLTIDVGKRQHYILPLMPAMAILIGILLEDLAFGRKVYTKRLARNILKGHIIVMVAGAIGLFVYVAIVKPQLLISIITLGIIMIAATFIVTILFAKGKPAAACCVIFSGITIWFMVSFAYFSISLDENRFSRDFAKDIAGIVPPSDKLIAYQDISSKFVQYFGKVVPVIQDKSLLYERYEQGDWVVCTSAFLNELKQDNRLIEVYYRERTTIKIDDIFRMVYYSQGARTGKQDSGGSLFHKSETAVKDGDNGEFE